MGEMGSYTDGIISLHQACFTTYLAIVTSLLQAIKRLCQCCPPSIFMCFSQGSILESLVKKIWIDKVIQLLLKVATQIKYKKDRVSINIE